jgi:hypothetical protein
MTNSEAVKGPQKIMLPLAPGLLRRYTPRNDEEDVLYVHRAIILQK